MEPPRHHLRLPGAEGLARWWGLAQLATRVLAQALRPGSYQGTRWHELATELVRATYGNLAWFTLMAALAALVITRIVVVTALSYGLSRYALEMVIRVLVLELIPLAAAVFVAVRYSLPASAELARATPAVASGAQPDPEARLLLPRVLAGAFAVLALAASAGVVTVLLAYAVAHGLSPWAWGQYTRTVGQVLSPTVAVVFVLKTLLFAAAVGVVPPASALLERRHGVAGGPELLGLLRMLAVMLLVELGSLLVNYHGANS